MRPALRIEPALALYRARGFASGPPFGDYEAGGFNQFLHLALCGRALASAGRGRKS